MAVSSSISVCHTVHVLESGICILEMKNGGYEPLADADMLKLGFMVHGYWFMNQGTCSLSPVEGYEQRELSNSYAWSSHEEPR